MQSSPEVKDRIDEMTDPSAPKDTSMTNAPSSTAAISHSTSQPAPSMLNVDVNQPLPSLPPTKSPAFSLTPNKNPALQVTAHQTIHLASLPVPATPLAPHDVLLHIKTTGICGSDMHLWHTGGVGDFLIRGTYTLGHEPSGIVLRCGSAVTSLRPGDRVAIEPLVPCSTCFLCTAGDYNLCADRKFTGLWPHEGTIQRYKVHPAKWCYKIPDGMSYSQASLVEPLSVVLHAVEGVRIRIGRGLAVIGAGPIGLIAAAVARASGAWPVVVADVVEERLEFARGFVPGGVRTWRVERARGEKGNAEGIRGCFGGGEYEAPPVVLECVGTESTINMACYVVRRKGTVMVIGVGKSTIDRVPFMHMNWGEIELKFSNCYKNTWPAGIAAISGGVLDLDKLVTHKFPLEQAVEAFELASDVSKGSIKVQIVDDVDVQC